MDKTKYLQDLGKIILTTEAYILHDGKVLMHKRSRNKKAFPDYWIGPGGHIDEKEVPLIAAIREVKEETEVIINENKIKLKVICFHYHVDRNELFVNFIYRAAITQKHNLLKQTEEGRSEWIPLAKLFKLKKLFLPSKIYFDHVLNDKAGIMYANIFWKNCEIVKINSKIVDKNT